jgi:hypothetical protein
VTTRALLHPVAIASIALLVINDHVLKAAYGTWWTGKLSDVAGLAVFPLLVCAGVELVTRRPLGVRAVAIAAAVTAAAFAAFKLSAPAGDVYRVGLAAAQWPLHAVRALLDGGALPALGRAQLTPDPTDLLALPAVGVSIFLASRMGVWGSCPAPPAPSSEH